MNPWLMAAAGLVLGLALGGALALALRGRSRESNDPEVQRLRREMESYREEVGEHFVETAALVNSLTQTYKAVYDHLESGAYRLVGETELRARLEDVDAEPVMLEYIGQRRRGGEKEDEGRSS